MSRPTLRRPSYVRVTIDDNLLDDNTSVCRRVLTFRSEASAFDRRPHITLNPRGGVDGNNLSFGTVETRDCIFNVTGGCFMDGPDNQPGNSFSTDGDGLTCNDMYAMDRDLRDSRARDRTVMILRFPNTDRFVCLLRFIRSGTHTARTLCLFLGRHSSMPIQEAPQALRS